MIFMQSEANVLELESVLREKFGYGSFRPGQRELIEAVLDGRDALGVLPTGGGKSITYQLPATLLQDVTIVVSPLIALMTDQVEAFNRRGGSLAVALHSNLPPGEAARVLAQVRGGRASLLYVAPERLELPGFRELMVALKPKLFVIDEAHCVSQWGYDFRPSYLALQQIVSALRPSPVLALTATATPPTQGDIVRGLNLDHPLLFVAPFDRPNLSFEVHPCKAGDKPHRLLQLVREQAGKGSQIVYVGRRKDADEIAATLSSYGLGAVPYHAGMAARQRQAAQEAWLSGKNPIAVATVAFGMGIDKPDVRAVIHYQHPASLEAYYQEAGRAGRDGAPARCITLFSTKDVSLAHYFIRNRYPSRDQVVHVLQTIPPDGTSPDTLKYGTGDLSDEQVKVALLALLEQGRIRRDEHGNFRREKLTRASLTFSLNAMFARKNADYRRLDAVVAYCTDTSCHRAYILRYFGERLAEAYRCGNCSACSGGSSRTGWAASQEEAGSIYQAHRDELESGAAISSEMFARFLRGRASRKIPSSWRRLAGFGAFSNTPMSDLRALAVRVLETQAARPPAKRAAAQVVSGGSITRDAGIGTRGPSEDPESSGNEKAPFWRSNERAFSSDELKNRKVPRTVGLCVLGLVAEVEGRLSPSGVANLLRGSRTCSAVKTEPELGNLKHFGVHRESSYAELLPDVLAMCAKGYLGKSSERSKRLVLTPKGRAVLDRY
jgi:ATP-dependent DNA helicase RecQ